MEALRFTGKTVLVTGAGAGFGSATALAFARDGARNVGLVELHADRLDAVAAEIEALGATPIPIGVDLCDTSTAAAVVERMTRQAGGIDVLVSNHAAMSWPVDFLDGTDDEWQREIDVSLTSHYTLARHTARSMRDRGVRGSIAFTASINALGAEAGQAGYCVTKAGLVALMKVMAVDLAPHGIRVNCVSPGPGDTQRSTDLVGEAQMRELRENGFPGIPLNRLATPDDIAEAFLYLASDAAGYVTGQNLVVDGGLTAFAYLLPEA